MHQAVLWLALFLLLPSFGVVAERPSGSAGMNLREVINCKEEESTNKLSFENIKIGKFNLTVFTLNGNFNFSTEFSDNLHVDMYAEIWGNGGWRSNFFKQTFKKPCSFFQQVIPEFTEQLVKKFNVTSCPIPPNAYYIKDLSLDFNTIKIPMKYGRYRCKALIKDKEEILGCIIGVAEFFPK